MRAIKTIKSFYKVLLLILIILVACDEEEFIGQPGSDAVAPGKITNLTYKATPGGAIVSYTLPNDEDVSHVEAINRVSETVERKYTSTKFTQNILVDGFGNTNPQQVDLYAVDKSGNKSEKVSLEVVPLTPPYITVFESLKVESGYGGIFMDWENDGEERVENIGITILKEDIYGDFVPFEVIYDDITKLKTDYTLRGLDTSKVEFRFFVRDKFEHVSDTLSGLFKPLLEVQIDHENVTPLQLDTDALTNPGNSYNINKIADGLTKNKGFSSTSNHYHSIKDTEKSYLPLHITLDLSVETNLSRIILYSTWWDAYKNGGIKKLEFYGTNDQALIDRETNGAYLWSNDDDPNVTGNWREEGMDGWDYIGEFETIKPSGLPGTQVVSSNDGDTDRVFSRNGFEFIMPGGTSYKYVRLRAIEMWQDGIEYISLEEVQFFGGPKE